jgi:DnaJ-like protein
VARLDGLLYALASGAGTGAVIVGFPVAGAARLELERGFVHSLVWDQGATAHPRAEENLRRLLRREETRARFEADAPRERRGRVTPFHPAGVLRNHFEAALAPNAGALLRVRAGRERIRLALAPHPSCLAPDEKRLLTLLATPRAVAELDVARVATPVRVERLLAFLEAAGGLAVGPSLHELLGLRDGAPLDEVRRAYKRVARDLHPDLHPGASDAERRGLEARLSALTIAYRARLDSE